MNTLAICALAASTVACAMAFGVVDHASGEGTAQPLVGNITTASPRLTGRFTEPGVVPLPSLRTLGGSRIFIGATCNFNLLFSNLSKRGQAKNAVEQAMVAHILGTCRACRSHRQWVSEDRCETLPFLKLRQAETQLRHFFRIRSR